MLLAHPSRDRSSDCRVVGWAETRRDPPPLDAAGRARGRDTTRGAVATTPCSWPAHGHSKRPGHRSADRVVVIGAGRLPADRRVGVGPGFYDTAYAGSWPWMPELVRRLGKQRAVLEDRRGSPSQVAIRPRCRSPSPRPGRRPGRSSDIVVVAPSSTSEAGVSQTSSAPGPRVMGAMSAYGVGGVTGLRPRSGRTSPRAVREVTVSFTPTLAPMSRRDPRHLHCPTRAGVPTQRPCRRGVARCLRGAGPVHLLPVGQWPKRQPGPGFQQRARAGDRRRGRPVGWCPVAAISILARAPPRSRPDASTWPRFRGLRPARRGSRPVSSISSGHPRDLAIVASTPTPRRTGTFGSGRSDDHLDRHRTSVRALYSRCASGLRTGRTLPGGRVAGPLEFRMYGVMAQILAPLVDADQRPGDVDLRHQSWILVQSHDELRAATGPLAQGGLIYAAHVVREARREASLPRQGFRATGVTAGLKTDSRPDRHRVVDDGPASTPPPSSVESRRRPRDLVPARRSRRARGRGLPQLRRGQYRGHRGFRDAPRWLVAEALSASRRRH